jgi:hypothetical protein
VEYVHGLVSVRCFRVETSSCFVTFVTSSYATFLTRVCCVVSVDADTDADSVYEDDENRKLTFANGKRCIYNF